MADKRKQIVEWFDAPKPTLPIKSVLIGIVLFGIGTQTHWVILLAGLGVMGVGIAMYMAAKSRYDARPSDSQMDQYIEEDVLVLRQRALTKFGVEKEDLVAEPVQVLGPKLWNLSDPHLSVKFRTGHDHVFRFSPIAVTVIDFAADQLLGYSAILDLTTGNALSEETDEYFYRDVVSVSTKTRSETVQIPQKNGQPLVVQMNAAETFELTTSGGTSISVLIRDPNLIKTLVQARGDQQGEIPASRAEKAVAVVRKMLREKKAAQL